MAEHRLVVLLGCLWGDSLPPLCLLAVSLELKSLLPPLEGLLLRRFEGAVQNVRQHEERRQGQQDL
jgi:hypothetical protein